MRRFRFTIGGMLVLVVYIAVAIAALRGADRFWDSAVFSVVVGLLLGSVALTAHGAGGKRAFWFGFTLFSGGYLALSLIPGIGDRLLTTRALILADSKVPRAEPSWGVIYSLDNAGAFWTRTTDLGQLAGPVSLRPAAASVVAGQTRSTGDWIWDTTGPGHWSVTDSPSQNFIRIGHSFLALLVGYLGGLFSVYLHRRRRDGQAVDSTSLPSTA